MNKLSIILLLSIHASFAFAQIDNNLAYSSFLNLTNAAESPARLGMNNNKGEFQIINTNAYISSNILSLEEIINVDELNIFETVKDKLQTQNPYLNLSTNLQVFNGQFNINIKGENKLAMALGVANQNYFSFSTSDHLFDLLINGNGSDSFRGKSVEIPFDLNTFSNFEITAGLAIELPSFIKESRFRVGGKLKYLLSLIDVNTVGTSATLTTDEYGRSLDLDFNSQIESTIQYEDSTLTITPNLNNGRGFAVDLGAHLNIKERLFFDLSLINVGSLKFKDENANGASESIQLNFNGLEIENIFNSEFNIKDSLINTVENLIDEEIVNYNSIPEYTTTTPSRIRFSGGIGLSQKEKKEEQYNVHTFYITIVQELKEGGAIAQRTYLAPRYILNIGNVLELGVNAGYINKQRNEMGGHIALRLGKFRFGLGSRNIITALNEEEANLNIATNISFAF